MNEALLDRLKASVLLEALREIEEIADDEVDTGNHEGPYAAMRILQIARSALNKVDPT